MSLSSATSTFQITQPFPARRSGEVLRELLIQHLLQSSPSIGDRFFSDHQLMQVSGLSRPTVRRALDALHREGWIERRHGRGTFVGPRVAMTIHRRVDGQSQRRLARLAIVTAMTGPHDWYANKVIAGIDSVADELQVAMEIFGYGGGDVSAVSRRLAKNLPDVLAFASPAAHNMFLVGECRRLGIPCIATGSSLQVANVPSAMEDGLQGGRLAVQHLVAHGHRRIGLTIPTYVTPWVFTRRQGYLTGLSEAGIEPDERLVFWYPGRSVDNEFELMQRYLDLHQPTALICSNFGGVATLSRLVSSGRLRIPHDLSVIHFDQHPDCPLWLGVRESSCISLPLEKMGQYLAHMVRRLADGQTLDPVTILPNQVRPGDSVAHLQGV